MERLDSSSSYFPPHPGKVKKKESLLFMDDSQMPVGCPGEGASLKLVGP